jgi:hypothetical protein
MQVRCIKARDGAEVGDLAEVPDGSVVSGLYWEVVAPAADPPPAYPASPPATPVPVSPRGMDS